MRSYKRCSPIRRSAARKRRRYWLWRRANSNPGGRRSDQDTPPYCAMNTPLSPSTKGGGVSFWRMLIRTDRSVDEDAARRSSLLQIVLLACMSFLLVLFFIAAHDALAQGRRTGVPLFIFILLFLLFWGLLLAARSGREKIAGYFFIAM